jgi:hypothetical protein
MTRKTHHPLYTIWRGIRRRCRNPKMKFWENYGGRGIQVCKEWDDFYRFAADVGPRPSRWHSIDRVDNDGHYEPGNVRWATKSEQMLNRRGAVYVEVEGVRYRAHELSKRSGRKPDTIVERARKGMTLEEVLSPKKHVPRRCIEAANAGRRANARARTHCKYGHPWNEENTYFTKGGAKVCRICHKLKMRRLVAAKKERQSAPL